MAVQFNTWAPGQVITAEKLNQMEEHIGESNALVQTEMDNMTSMQEALGFVPKYALVTTVGGAIDAEGNYAPNGRTYPTFTNFFKVPKSGKILISWEQNVNNKQVGGTNQFAAYVWDSTQNTYLGSMNQQIASGENGSIIFPDDIGNSITIEPGMWVRFSYPSTTEKYVVGISFSDVYQPAYGTVDEGIIAAQSSADAAQETADTATTNITTTQTFLDDTTESFSDILGIHPKYNLVLTEYTEIDSTGNVVESNVNRITTNLIRVPTSGNIRLSWTSGAGNNQLTMGVYNADKTFIDKYSTTYFQFDSNLSVTTAEKFPSITLTPGQYVRFQWPNIPTKYANGMVITDGYTPGYDNVDEGIKTVNILQKAELNPETSLFCSNFSQPASYVTAAGNTLYLNGAKTTETQGYRRIFLTDTGLVECHYQDTSNFPVEGDFTKKLTAGHKYKLTVIRKGSSVVISGGVTTTTIQDNFQIGTYNDWQSLTALKFTEESATIQTATFVAPDAPIIINMYIRNNTFNDLQFSYWLEDLQKVEFNPETSTFCYNYSEAGNYVSSLRNTIRLNGAPASSNRRVFLTDNGVAECLYTDTSSYPSSTKFTKKLISGHTYKLTVLREGTPPDDTYSNNFQIGTYDNWDKPIKMYWYSYSDNIQIATFAATDDPIIINLFIRSASFNDLRYTYWLEDVSNIKTSSLKKNPYQNIPWEQIQDITSVTHAHILWKPDLEKGYYPQPQFEALQAKYDHLAISAYHPSAPMYPLEQRFENIDSNILSSPNAEFAGFTGESENLHLNAVGSLFSSRTGGDGGIGTLAEFVQEAEECMIGNGGIITINHPAWTVYKMNKNGTVNTTTAADMVNKIITIMDLSDRVAALEVWNASCEKNSQTGISTEIWDGVLSLGRQIYATAVPDHYVQYPAQDETAYGCGFNHMLVVNKTSEEVLAAYRTGHFYTTQYDDDLKLTYIHQNKTASSESYNDIEIQVAAEATFLFKTATRSVEITTPATSATFTPQDGDVYVRVEAHRGNNTLWTNAIML